MSCSNNMSTSGGCGCGSSTSSTSVAPPCAPPCASAVAGNCVEYMNAACTVINDSTSQFSVKKGDSVEAVLQKIMLYNSGSSSCFNIAAGKVFIPVPLQSTNVTISTINVSWGKADANLSGEPIYEVMYKLNDPTIGTWTSLPQQSTTTATITGLLSMQSYQIKVKPVYPDNTNSTCTSITIIVTTL